MADAPSTTTNQTKSPTGDDLALKLRVSVSNAYAFVAGRQQTQSFLALTWEDLAARQVQRISGNGTPTRPSLIARIQKIEQDVVSAAQQIKQLPPDAFNSPDTNRDVNTPP